MGPTLAFPLAWEETAPGIGTPASASGLVAGGAVLSAYHAGAGARGGRDGDGGDERKMGRNSAAGLPPKEKG
jgi:hypothetical protein